jgi:hypothetical protein
MASEAKPRCGQDVGRVEMLAGMIPLTNDNEQSTDGEMPDLVDSSTDDEMPDLVDSPTDGEMPDFVDSEPEAYHFPIKRKTRPRTRHFNEIAYRMHKAMLLDNRENKTVLKAARMNGWVSHRPTQNGLVPLEGDDRRYFLLGSSRLLQETVFLKGPACHSTSDPPPSPTKDFFPNE